MAIPSANPRSADVAQANEARPVSPHAGTGRGALFSPAWARRTLVGVLLVALAFPLYSAAFPLWVWALGVAALIAPRSDLLLSFGSSLASVAFLLVPALGYSPAGALAPDGIRLAMLFGFLGGPAMLWLATQARRAEPTRTVTGLSAVLIVGGIAIASLVPFFQYTNALEINQVARARPSAGAVLIGFAALLLARRGGVVVRIMALMLAIVGISPAVLASEMFRHRVARDPLLAGHTVLNWRDPPREALAVWHVSEPLQTLELSPGGTAIIGGLSSGGFVALGPGSTERKYPAVKLRFIDDERVIGIFNSKDGLELREYRTTASPGEGAPVWRRMLPSLKGMKLDVDPKARTWHVHAPLGDAVKVWTGVLGDEHVSEEIWPPEPRAEDQRLRAKVPGRSDLIVRSLGRPRPSPELEGWDVPLPVASSGWNAELWFSDVSRGASLLAAKTRLRVRCERPATGRSTFPCTATDDWESYVWVLDPSMAASAPTHVLTVEGRIVLKVGPDGTLLAKTYNDMQWIDFDRHVAVRIPYPRRPDHLFTGPEIVAIGSRKIALVDESRGTASVYALP
jgi:hypothetical protein